MNDPLDDLLDARLRDEMSYIDDAGFTARVMKQLPRRRLSWSSQRSFIILAAAILSVVVAYFASGEGMFVHDAFARMSGLRPLQLLFLILTCGLAMTIAGLWAALTRRHDTIV
jgi:anti-sigma factor RsiW